MNLFITDQKLVAIESGILGGSIALFENGIFLDSLVGDNDTSRAEDLLSDLNRLVDSNNLEIDQISSFAISRGPGSYTGLRIGLSTAFGITSAVNTKMIGVPLFEAINFNFDFNKSTLILLPFSKKEFVWQFFLNEKLVSRKSNFPEIYFYNNFDRLISELQPEMIVCHPALKEIASNIIIQQKEKKPKLLFLSACLAEYVGRWACTHPEINYHEPIYSLNRAKHSNFL